MLATLIILASSTTIPFGSPKAPEPGTASTSPAQRYEMGFEFAEQQAGYLLNAVLFDQRTGRRTKTAIVPCQTIDIDSFTETDFGTPVICNDVTYTFDVRQGAIVAAPMEGGRVVEVKRLMPGRAYINGMPLLIEANR